MRRSTGPARDLRVLASGRSTVVYQSHMGGAQPFELCGIASPIWDLGRQTDGRRLVYMSREVVEKVLRHGWRRDNDGADI